MNRSFDIFRQSANGVDPDRGTGGPDPMRARTNRNSEPPFGHGVHSHPSEWGHHAQQLEGSADYGHRADAPTDPRYERGGERAVATYGGFIGDRERFDDHERFLAERERHERDRYDAQREQRARFAEHEQQDRYVRGGYDTRGYPRSQEPEGRERYWGARPSPAGPAPRSMPPRWLDTGGGDYPQGQVWRGRDEERDFWGFERHPDEHPSLWDRVKGVFHGRGPKNYVRSDERIHEDVCEHLAYHPYVDASDIEVIVRDGEVTLTGTVDARMVKRAAEECCDQVRGVKDVHNHLRVRRPEQAVEEVPAAAKPR